MAPRMSRYRRATRLRPSMPGRTSLPFDIRLRAIAFREAIPLLEAGIILTRIFDIFRHGASIIADRVREVASYQGFPAFARVTLPPSQGGSHAFRPNADLATGTPVGFYSGGSAVA